MNKKSPLEVFHRLSRAISRAAKLEEIYEIILGELIHTFGVERASIMQFQPKQNILKIVAARGMEPEVWKNISIPAGKGASGGVFSRAKPMLIKKKRGDPRYKTHSYMIAPVLSFPMKVGKVPIGVINVTDKKSGAPFTRADLKLLTTLSDQVAAYMHLCDLLERVQSGERAKLQLEMAHTIQQRLLPDHPPDIGGVEVAGCLLAAQKVGADFYDFFSSDGKTLNLCIADVSGHDVGGALLAFALRSCMRSEALHRERPARLSAAMNRLLFEDLMQAEQFISLVYAQYRPGTRTLTFTNAGHNPPLLWRSRQKSETWLSTQDALLGVDPKQTYHQKSCKLRAGDLILFYTDGVTEALNSKKERFGTTRLAAAVRRGAQKSAPGIRASLLAEWKRFTGEGVPKDDVTLLVLKIL